MKIKISPLLIPLIAGAYFGNYMEMFSTAYLTAILHEFAHIFVAKINGVKINAIHIMPFGVCAVLDDNLIKKPSNEISIAIAGPLFNIISFAIIKYLAGIGTSNSNLIYAGYLNLSMALLNLIPCLPLDGSRILRACLTLRLGGLKAYLVTVKLSRILIVLILALAILLLLFTKFNFSLILIGVFLLGNLGREQKSITVMALKEILNHKEKLRDDDVNHITYIAVYADMPAGKVLKHFSYHKYYMIHILDNDENIIKTLSEGQVINALIKKGMRTKMRDI